MKLTIIPSDGAVYKNGISYVGLSIIDVPNNIHALQWNNDKGWIEFISDENFSKLANELIVTLPDWAISAVLKWDEAKTAEDAAIAAAKTAALEKSNTPEPVDEPQA